MPQFETCISLHWLSYWILGEDLLASNATDRLNKYETLLREAKRETEDAERKLTDTEVKTIHVEGKYAEEHAEELETERQNLIKIQQQMEAQTEGNKEDGTAANEQKEKQKEGDSAFDGFIEIFDKWGCGEDDR